MPHITHVLTPEALRMLEAVHRTGSLAAAAREQGLVPSALTYRVRQLEDALDVLLLDRSSRQAKLTEAGHELLREGRRLLADLEAVAHRVKRVATGWEPQFTLAVDGVVSRSTVMELCAAFYAQDPPTRLKIREEALSGTLEALTSGQADLALGVAQDMLTMPGFQSMLLGSLDFIFAVAPQHALAQMAEPLSDAVLRQHRAVAVADSVQCGSAQTVGLLGGQDVLTVPNMMAKLEAQLHGLGAGFLPSYLVRPYLASGRLVVKQVERPTRIARISCAWRQEHTTGAARPGRALQWWLTQLQSPVTRQALLNLPQVL